MRKPLMAGNWKMNCTVKDAVELVKELKKYVKDVKNTEILVCPPFTALNEVSRTVKDSNIELGAQNMGYEDSGAFTGEISPLMLRELKCRYVILGHSERRHIFNENDGVINKKIKCALKNNLKPILCVGETLLQRRANLTKKIILNQIQNGLKDIKADDMKNIVVAYEPVWAIGTGKTAMPYQAQEIHASIRDLLEDMFNQDVGFNTRIIYGGSVKPDNIKELMMQSDIDGALVGGASLKAKDFSQIIRY
ncbi:MAG: triose-phosphate isomerase [Nanoarchaeota archaeon]|nr:triose-phosphate isomerase [Nanoarchaeota archaeon]